MKLAPILCIFLGILLRVSYCRTLPSNERATYKAVETNGKLGVNKILTMKLLIGNDEFECPSSDGVFPADDQCTGDYYLCVDGDSYIQHCPGNYIFDDAADRCLPPSESSCIPGQGATPTTTERTTTRKIEESTTSPQQEWTTSTQQGTTSTRSSTTTTAVVTTTSPSGTFTCPSSNGNYPIPGTCGSDYYVCIADFPYIANCPYGEIFDPSLYKCVPANEASCYSPFVCPQDDGFFPIPGTCSGSYYVCVAGNPNIATCPNGGIFDPVLYACVPLNEASCYSPFVCPQEDGFFPIPDTCSGSYYVCIAGNPLIGTCPEDLIFDPLLNECLPQQDASCNPASYDT